MPRGVGAAWNCCWHFSDFRNSAFSVLYFSTNASCLDRICRSIAVAKDLKMSITTIKHTFQPNASGIFFFLALHAKMCFQWFMDDFQAYIAELALKEALTARN